MILKYTNLVIWGIIWHWNGKTDFFTWIAIIPGCVYWKLYWCYSGDHYGDDVWEVVIGVKLEVDEVAACLMSIRLYTECQITQVHTECITTYCSIQLSVIFFPMQQYFSVRLGKKSHVMSGVNDKYEVWVADKVGNMVDGGGHGDWQTVERKQIRWEKILVI